MEFYMKTLMASFPRYYILIKLLPFIPLLISFLLALLSGYFLFSEANIGKLVSIIINIGLDPLRAQLIAALVMAIGTALVGAVVGRSKLGALVGAGIAFWF